MTLTLCSWKHEGKWGEVLVFDLALYSQESGPDPKCPLAQENVLRIWEEKLMAYRNKTYIAFDADSDIHYYRLMQAWKQNDGTDFDFYNAHDINDIRQWSTEDSKKAALRERMQNSKVFILLVGDKTKFQNTYVRWECEQALRQQLPIIVVNLNGMRSIDQDRCPLILRDELAVHISYNQAIIQNALEHWPNSHALYQSQGKTGPFYYTTEAYKQLGL